MLAIPLHLTTYLTSQLQEIIGLGPLHALTWATRADWSRWMQISVHDGRQHYLAVQIKLPPHVSKKQIDRIFRQNGLVRQQADASDCLLYYLARTASPEKLLAQAETIARQCADAMRTLWNVTAVEQVGLLAARGPRLAVQKAQPAPHILPQAA